MLDLILLSGSKISRIEGKRLYQNKLVSDIKGKKIESIYHIYGKVKDEKIEKYSLKTKEGNLIALGAYRVMGRKAYVYILYLESAPASNPTLTAKREYYGIGEVMIAFGIKFSIDSGCRGDVLFEAKTPELARHYEKDFHARQVATLNSGGPQRYMLADENAWNLFEKFLAEEEP